MLEPRHELLGIGAHESVISVRSDGTVLIPFENYQLEGVPIRLEEGVELGTARKCDLTEQKTSDVQESSNVSEPEIYNRCAVVKALLNTPEHSEQLLKRIAHCKCSQIS